MENNFKNFSFFSIVLVFGMLVSSCQNQKNSVNSKENKVKLVLENGFTVLDTFANGTARTTMRVIEDTSHLEVEIYHSNGSISMRGQTVNGARDGEWYAYDKEGHLLTIGTYKLGVDDGLKTVYFPTGQKYYEGKFENGKRVGEWIFWDETGKIIEKIKYDK